MSQTTTTTTTDEEASNDAPTVVVPVVVQSQSPEGVTTETVLELQEKILRLERELEETRNGLHNRIDNVQASVTSTLEPTEVAEVAVTEVIPEPIQEIPIQEPQKTKSWFGRLLLGR